MLTQTVYLSVDFNLGVSQTGFVEFWVEQVSSLGSSVANGVVDATGPTVFQLPIHEHFLSIDVCEHILNFVRFIVACYEDMWTFVKLCVSIEKPSPDFFAVSDDEQSDDQKGTDEEHQDLRDQDIPGRSLKWMDCLNFAFSLQSHKLFSHVFSIGFCWRLAQLGLRRKVHKYNYSQSIVRDLIRNKLRIIRHFYGVSGASLRCVKPLS